MMVFEIKPQHAESTHFLADSDSRIFAAIPGQTVIGPVIQVHIIQFLGINGIEIQIPSTTTQNRTLFGSDMPRGEPIRG